MGPFRLVDSPNTRPRGGKCSLRDLSCSSLQASVGDFPAARALPFSIPCLSPSPTSAESTNSIKSPIPDRPPGPGDCTRATALLASFRTQPSMAPPTFSTPVDDVEVTESKDVRGATLGKCGANILFSRSWAGPGLCTSLPSVPTPPGPSNWCAKCEPEVDNDFFRWCLFSAWLLAIISSDAIGISRSEKVVDFRLLGGKKPSVLRDKRPISTASVKPSIITHDSCFHGWSSGSEADTDGEVCILEKGVPWTSGDSAAPRQGLCALVGVAIDSSIIPSFERPDEFPGSGNLRPFTPHASTGKKTVFLTWMLSLGHNLLAFRNAFGWQLYLIITPARVSLVFTLCIYTKVSRSSLSARFAKEALRSSESLRLYLPVASGRRWLSAANNVSRFLAWTCASRSSRDPNPSCWPPDPEGPHWAGPLLLRPCVASRGRRFGRGDWLPTRPRIVSPLSKLDAMFCTEDQDVPHRPGENIDDDCARWGLCPNGSLVRLWALDEPILDGSFETVSSEDEDVAAGPSRPRLWWGWSSINAEASSPSSRDIRRLIRGRRVAAEDSAFMTTEALAGLWDELWTWVKPGVNLARLDGV